MGQGFIPGVAHMAAASRVALSRGRAGPKRRRRKASKVARRTRRAKGSRKMKFGSPAWQKKYKVGRFAKRRR